MDYGKLRGKVLMNMKGETFFDLLDDLLGTRETKMMRAFKLILKQINPDSQEWFNHQGNRDKIKEALDITEPTINAYIGKFVKKGVLLKQPPRGLYKLNDKYLKLL